MKLIETKITGQSIYKGKILEVVCDKVELVDGRTSKREVVLHNGGACVLAINNQQEIYFVKQYRYSIGQVLLELPAGKIDIGETALNTAIRELKEEVGLVCNTINSLGIVVPTCGYSSELIHLYYTDDFTIDDISPDIGEYLELCLIPLKEALVMIDNDIITDAKTIISILKYVRVQLKLQ